MATDAKTATALDCFEIAFNRFGRLYIAAAHKGAKRPSGLKCRSMKMSIFENATSVFLSIATQALAIGILVAL